MARSVVSGVTLLLTELNTTTSSHPVSPKRIAVPPKNMGKP